MCKKRLSIFLFLISVLTMACVPNSKYVALENELTDTLWQLEQEKNKQEEMRVERDRLALQIEDLEKDFESLQEQHQHLIQINQRLADNLQELSISAQKLNIDLEKHKSVVQLQDQVIKLLDDTKRTIESSLKDEIATQGIEIVDTKNQVKVVLIDKILYEPGSMEINEEGKNLLLLLAESLKKDKTQQIVVEGHTDNIPLSRWLQKIYPTNWELSAARAASVVRFLQDEGGLDPERLSIRAYSYYRPIAANDTAEGRGQNRRIEIVLGSPNESEADESREQKILPVKKQE
jgi:chemotaxis protein MotB